MKCVECGMKLHDGFSMCEGCEESRLDNMTEAELRADLQQRGVDVDAFLKRMRAIIDSYKPFNAAQFDADLAEGDE